MGVKNKNKNDNEVVLEIEIRPVTWIIAPLVEEEQLKAWREKGWIDEEKLHLDRAFPRDCDGKPFIPKSWIKAVLTRVIQKYNLQRQKVMSFNIVDDEGYIVNYITIPKRPLTYRRHIGGEKPSTEYFEYLDGTFILKFKVVTRHPKDFIEALIIGGKDVGLLSRTKWGYGRFKVLVKN